jgi:hypothetical protein
MALPLFFIIGATQRYGSRDIAGTILSYMPLFWVTFIGSHCLLYLICDRPDKPTGVVGAPMRLVEEQIRAFAVDPRTMAFIYQGVLNKNVLADLSGLVPLCILPPGATLDVPYRSFAMTKFPALAVFVDGMPELPIAIDADVSILAELRKLITVSDAEAEHLCDLSHRQPTFCRFYVSDTTAAHWPLPTTPSPASYLVPKKG